jgi:hypothetical protein
MAPATDCSGKLEWLFTASPSAAAFPAKKQSTNNPNNFGFISSSPCTLQINARIKYKSRPDIFQSVSHDLRESSRRFAVTIQANACIEQ